MRSLLPFASAAIFNTTYYRQSSARSLALSIRAYGTLVLLAPPSALSYNAE